MRVPRPWRRVARPAQNVRQFKEGAWRSPDAVGCYEQAILNLTPGMGIEARLVCRSITGRVLDVGTGTGRIARCLVESGADVVGLDISSAMLRTVEIPNVVGSAFDLPFSDDTFENACAIWLLLHFEQWDDILAEMIRVVRPGGSIVFELPNPEHLKTALAAADRPEDVDPTVDHMGFQVFPDADAVRDAAEANGARLVLSEPYELFADNLIVRAALKDRYDHWQATVFELLRDSEARAFWTEFEASVLPELPRSLGRKNLYVLMKRPEVAFKQEAPRSLPHPPSAALRIGDALVGALQERTPALARAIERAYPWNR